MIKFLKKEFKYFQYRWRLKKYFQPRKEFLKTAKDLFLKSLEQKKFRGIRSYSPWKHLVKYVSAAFLFSFILSGGAIVFANGADVGYNHPLYPFKRTGEYLQVRFASRKGKLRLYHKFAERRLKEIQKEKLSNRKNQTIKKLENDFNDEIHSAFKIIKNSKKEKKKITDLCDLLYKAKQETTLTLASYNKGLAEDCEANQPH